MLSVAKGWVSGIREISTSHVLKKEYHIIVWICSIFDIVSLNWRLLVSCLGFFLSEEVEFEELVGDKRKQSSIGRRHLDVVH